MYTPQPIFWDESLATGDKDLDSQHKYLIEICNDLATAIKKKRGAEVIAMVLDVLTFYAEWHFKKEENCMERYRCLVADKNLKAHALFMHTLKKYQVEYQTSESPESLALQIHQFLAGWIVSHILHIDTHLQNAIQSQPDQQGGVSSHPTTPESN